MSDFMFVKRSMILEANERKVVNEYANFFMILSNTSSTDVEIALGHDALSPCPAGISIGLPQGEDFTSVAFQNPTGAQITVEYILSRGKVTNAQLVLAGVVDVDMSTDTIETPVALTVLTGATNSIAADSSQRELVVQNTGDYDVWWGDSNVDPSTRRGTKIKPDQIIILSSSAQVYFKASGGTSYISLNRLKAS